MNRDNYFKLMPLDENNNPTLIIRPDFNFKRLCKNHKGNLGILTGKVNNIIAIKICLPQLKFQFNFSPDDNHCIICTDDIDPKDVLSFNAPGYILFKEQSLST